MLVWKPTQEEILAAHGKTVPDVISFGLRVLFCGINPSVYSAAVGHHFARLGNRFWPTLLASGFTERLFSPFEAAEICSTLARTVVTSPLASYVAVCQELCNGWIGNHGLGMTTF